jgi:hypothetical protein
MTRQPCPFSSFRVAATLLSVIASAYALEVSIYETWCPISPLMAENLSSSVSIAQIMELPKPISLAYSSLSVNVSVSSYEIH